MILGIFAGILSVAAFVPYVLSILKGDTKPSRATWLVWSFQGIILFFAFRQTGARETLFVPFVYMVTPCLTAVLSIWYGSGSWSTQDRLCLSLSVLCTIFWIVSKSNFFSLLLFILIDCFGLIPTVQKTYRFPEQENLPAWILMVMANFLNLFAAQDYSFSVLVYPSYLLFSGLLITALILRPNISNLLENYKVFPKLEIRGIVGNMIPEFPESAQLNINHRQEIEKITSEFLPYSDFDFASMYSWNVEGKIKVSKLNDNLVVLFSDYLTGEPFLSFLGNNKVTETTEELLKYSSAKSLGNALKLIPEEVACQLSSSKFLMSEDRDSFDYIFDANEHSTFSGTAYSKKRNEVNSLLNSHPDVYSQKIDLTSKSNLALMTALYDKWANHKENDHKLIEQNERMSFQRLLEYIEAGNTDVQAMGIYTGDSLIAFCIYELSGTDYIIGHTAKSDSDVKGSNAYLMKCMAEEILRIGRRYFNYEQDLGLSNLRTAKERFRPVRFLKKYRVSFL